MKVISLFVAFQSPLVVCGLVLLAQSSIYHPCCAISFNSLLTLLELGRHSNVWKQRLGLFCLVEHRVGFKGLSSRSGVRCDSRWRSRVLVRHQRRSQEFLDVPSGRVTYCRSDGCRSFWQGLGVGHWVLFLGAERPVTSVY